MWYALFRASGSTIDSATSLNGVLKQDIINSKGVKQSGGVPGRNLGGHQEDFSGICPELTEVCKRKLGNICGMGRKPKDVEFKQDYGSWIATTAWMVIEEKIKLHAADPKKQAKPSPKTYKASALGLESFSSGAIGYARNWWKSGDARQIKEAAGLSRAQARGGG